MPVIVVGADTTLGTVITRRLLNPGREVRAFVTDETVAAQLKREGVKVATGDVSDDSHVSAACTNCFSAVLVTEAAGDDRQRSFADDPAVVLSAWAEAVVRARVKRVIWVTDQGYPTVPGIPETSVSISGRQPQSIAEEVAARDEGASI